MTDQYKAGVTLVLGTGLLKCSASIGMFKVLQREGIPIDRIVASGPGAIFGAGFALGYSDDAILGIVKDLNDYYKEGIIGPLRRLQMAITGLGNNFGLLDGGEYRAIFDKHFGNATFDDIKIPISVVATNFVNAERVILQSGAMAAAVATTGIVPGVIPPVTHQNQLLVGGAVSDPLPVSVAMDQGAGVIISMGFDSPYLKDINTIRDFVYQMNSIHANHLLSSQMALGNLSHHSEIIPIMPKFGVSVGIADTEHLDYLIQQGAEETEDNVAYLKRILA